MAKEKGPTAEDLIIEQNDLIIRLLRAQILIEQQRLKIYSNKTLDATVEKIIKDIEA